MRVFAFSPASVPHAGSIAALAACLAGCFEAWPSPHHVNGYETPFDVEAATAALEKTQYLDCGAGSEAELTVTFRNSGHVERVTIDRGAMDDRVALCVSNRFARAAIPPFSGPSRSLRCRIRLAFD